MIRTGQNDQVVRNDQDWSDLVRNDQDWSGLVKNDWSTMVRAGQDRSVPFRTG